MRRKVNFRTNKEDMTAAVLGMLGFSTDFIMSRTRLSQGQVLYRLQKAGIKRADYRYGSGPAAGLVLQYVERRALTVTRKQIEHKENGRG